MIPDVKSMNNDELATALRNSGARVGPITDTTRLVYERKLVRLLQDVPPSTSTEQLEESENEEEETVSQFTVEEKSSERLTSAYQRFTSPLASKISSANPTFTPSYIGTPGNSQLNTSLTRRPLSSMREEVKFTSLRKSEATPVSANAAPKKGISIMVKLLVLIVFGVIAWLIYINFEFAHTKPLLTTNQ